MSAGPATPQRERLLQELERHRRRIDELLSPAQPLPVRLARLDGGFPRSHTMRLVLSQPLLLAALSGLALRLLGPQALRLLPLAGAVARTVLAVARPVPAAGAAPAPPPTTGTPGGSDGSTQDAGRDPAQGHAAQGARPQGGAL